MNMRINSNSRAASCGVYLERMSEPSLSISGKGLYVGRSNIYNIPFLLDLDELINRNIAILGMSGSGKSYFLKSFIIRSVLLRGSAVLIIDWNNEYKSTVDYLCGNVLTLGSDLSINIMDLHDLNDTRHVRSISDLISYSLNLNQEESYTVYNAILTMAAPMHYSPKSLNLRELTNALRNEDSDICKRLANKLLQLRNNPMFGDRTEFDVRSLLNGVTSINFSMLKDDMQRGEISRTVLRIIVELMHSIALDSTETGAERIIVLDESWRLISNSEDVGVLFREGRKYGFCIAVATQLVNDISNEVLSNAASVFLFRLQNENDYRLLVSSGIMGENDRNILARLPVGSCMVSLAAKEDNGAVTKFFVKRIEGVATKSYKLYGGKMQNRISNKLFLESTRELLASNEVKDRIIDYAAKNNNEVVDTELVGFLISLNIERHEIVYYLRSLGLKDIDIIRAYNGAMPGSFR